ncbi:MAG: hypothetical protein ABMB14_19125 [Myxococcota bacterium]
MAVPMGMTVALAACHPPPDPSDTGSNPTAAAPVVEQDGVLTITTWSARSDADGRLALPIEVGPDTTSFLLSVTTSDEYPVLATLTDPSGAVVLDAADWLGDDESLTGAFERARKTSALNWPIRASDGPLTPGTWIAAWTSVDEQGAPTPDDLAEVTVLANADPDPARGTIHVRLVWADGVDAETGRQAAVEDAVDSWVDEWAAWGLDVVPTFHASSLDPGLPFTASGGADLEAVAQEVARPGDLVVVLGDTLVYDPYVYGTSASTPGSPIPGPYQFVAVALDQFVPPVGAIDVDHARLLTETIAHESAHFMGLSHVVETDWARFDALTDTPRCTSESTCEATLGTNLMFPTSYCTPRCPTRGLTPDQQAVLHRYAGTR